MPRPPENRIRPHFALGQVGVNLGLHLSGRQVSASLAADLSNGAAQGRALVAERGGQRCIASFCRQGVWGQGAPA